MSLKRHLDRLFPQPDYTSDDAAWNGYLRRLIWIYGPHRGRRIFNGEDDAANRDLAAWHALGEPEEVR